MSQSSSFGRDNFVDHAPNDDDLPGGAGGPQRFRFPRRSAADRKVAGVAGGLGRALGIDPLLIRVVFVILTVFGGIGLTFYVAGWLLLPADGDESSAAAALLGRGRSSVPSPLAVALCVVGAISVFSAFSWGLHFTPFVIVCIVIALIAARRGGRSGRRGHRSGWDHDGRAHGGWNQGGWNHHGWNRGASNDGSGWDHGSLDDHGRDHPAGRGSAGSGPASWAAQGQYWRHAEQMARQAQRFGQGWGHGWNDPTGASPFEQPAFFDSNNPGDPARSNRAGAATGGSRTATGGDPSPTPQSRVDLTKERPAPTDGANPTDAPRNGPAPFNQEPLLDHVPPRQTPPAWDPLGAAPFAWDLPEPSPLPAQPVRRPGSRVFNRVVLGLTVLAGAITAAGLAAGWWLLPWSAVTAIALAVLAVGLLISALRGRGLALAGPGMFLALVTLALAFTGIRGTTGFGQASWNAPISTSDLRPVYALQGGEGTLDLTKLTVPAGETVSTSVQVGAGFAKVELPSATNVQLTCSTNAGEIKCLDVDVAGIHQQQQTSATGFPQQGTLDLDVHVGAGYAEVDHG